jgi:hypothetical protein
LSKWPDFHGCWPIPGIKTAEFEVQTSNNIGTRIRVTNFDGSTHVEEIMEWEPAGFKAAAMSLSLSLFAVQLLLNIAWSWIFFGLH